MCFLLALPGYHTYSFVTRTQDYERHSLRRVHRYSSSSIISLVVDSSVNAALITPGILVHAMLLSAPYLEHILRSKVGAENATLACSTCPQYQAPQEVYY